MSMHYHDALTCYKMAHVSGTLYKDGIIMHVALHRTHYHMPCCAARYGMSKSQQSMSHSCPMAAETAEQLRH